MNQSYIRNFAIVAHIDHGKSTLADRLLEMTGTLDKRQMKEQILDSNPIERERGITIKLAPVRMKYSFPASSTPGESTSDTSGVSLSPTDYILNLIDTPGHVDFSYEVSRSLSACEGILLVVDATQGIQAQTMAHMQIIKQNELTVIPVINKIDLSSAKVEEVKKQLVAAFHFNPDSMIAISAKTGLNVDSVLAAIVERIPSPCGQADAGLRALVFSSMYDVHKGVIVYVKIVDGVFDPKKNIGGLPCSFLATGVSFRPVECGFFSPTMIPSGGLLAGEVGYIATGLKDLSSARAGDTIYETGQRVLAVVGYKEPKQMVFLSFFPIDNDRYLTLRESIEKLHLQDASFTYKPQFSPSLGKGFLCGFLGLLHADVSKERLEREYEQNVIATAPTVEYEVSLKTQENLVIRSPQDFPDPSVIYEIREPVVYVTIFSPKTSVGAIMQLVQEKRGEYINLEYIGEQAKFTYIIPLAEMIVDFFDRLKSISSGYASLDYEFYEYRSVDVVKLDVLLNRERVDAFSQIVVREKVEGVANALVEKLKEHIPRHQFEIPVQAAIGGKIIARADIKSFRKDVTAKLYGGDRTRKDKLLEAQKKGKKRLRSFGRVNIPQEVFLEIYK